MSCRFSDNGNYLKLVRGIESAWILIELSVVFDDQRRDLQIRTLRKIGFGDIAISGLVERGLWDAYQP